MLLNSTRLIPILCCFVLLGFSMPLQAQVYEIDEHFTIVDCDGTFVDDGGTVGGHDPTGVEEITICSNSSASDMTHIQLVFTQFEISGTFEVYNGPSVDPATLVNTLTAANNGTDPIMIATIANPSGCLTIRFTPDGTSAPGWNAFIQCTRACQSVEAALVSSDPEVMPVDTGYIDICPGDRVFFNGAGIYAEDGLVYDQDDATSTFSWNFNDGTTELGNNVSHVFEEPGGYTVQLTVTDINGCRNINQINQRVRVAPPPRFALQQDLQTTYCTSDTVSLSQSNELEPDPSTNLFVATDTLSFATGQILSDTTALPDGNGVSYETTIEFGNFIAGQTVTNIDDVVGICLNMEHSYAGDLEIEIICGDTGPGEQSVVLVEFPNGLGGTFLGEAIDTDNLEQGVGYDYCFTPGATTTWEEADPTFGTPFPAGDYESEEPLSGLIGCPLNGEWTIRVTDNLGIDDGWIFNWSISFADYLFPDLESFNVPIDTVFWQEAPNLIFYTSDSLAANPAAAGQSDYTLTMIDSFGCQWDTTVIVDVLPFSHPDCYDCQPMLDEVLQQDTVCSGGMIPTELATATQLDTAILWQSFPNADFGNTLYPNMAQAFSSVISVNSNNPVNLTDLNQIRSVCLNIETDFVSDINLFLRAPNGSLLELSTNNGAGGNNYTNTCFTPNAATPITAAVPPFDGEFQPEGNWNVLLGTPINGDWELVAYDDFGIQVGTFQNWTITFIHTNFFTYNWTPDDGNLSCTNCPDPVITANMDAVYEVTVTDQYGCEEMGQVEITFVSELPTLTPNCNSILGIGEMVFNWNPTSPSGQYEYTVAINGGPSGGTMIVSDTFITVTGLSNLDEVTLNVRPLITDPLLLGCVTNDFVELTCTYEACIFTSSVEMVADISCFGETDGTATFNFVNNDGELTYLLDGNPISIPADNILTGLSGGDYQLIVEDATTCTDTLDFTIMEPTAVTAMVDSSSVLCNGDASGQIVIVGAGGTGNLNYSLESGPSQASGTFGGLTANDYSISVSDENGCTFDSLITIDEPTAVSLMTTVDPLLCFDSNDGAIDLMVQGGVGPYTFDWNDLTGVNDLEDRTGLMPGDYTVTITDANGCETVREETVSAPDEIVLALTQVDSVSCFGGGDGEIQIVPTGGTGTLDFLWDDPNAQVLASAVFLTAGTYTLSATDDNGCMQTTTHQVFEPDELQINFNRVDVACRGAATGTATALATGGNGGYSYSWDTGDMGPNISDQTAGVYTVTITDSKGCMDIDSIQLTQPATGIDLSDIQQDEQGCFEQSLNIATVVPVGGDGNYSYLWSNGEVTATANNLPSGTAFVTVTDEAGCSLEQSIVLTDLEEITFNLFTMLPTCNGLANGGMGINQLTGGAGSTDTDYSFDWSSGSNNIFANNLLGGITYSVTVRDAQGCFSTQELLLPDPAPIVFQTNVEDVSCFGFSDGTVSVANIIGPNPGDYDINWSANAGGSTDATVNGLPAGSYSVQIEDVNGCTQSASLNISQPTAIDAALSTQDATCFGDADGQIIADVAGGTPGYTYEWSNNGNTAAISSLPAGEYQLIVRDANDCEFNVRATIEQPEQVTATAQSQAVICEGDATGRILAIGGGGRPPFTYSLDAQSFSRSDQFLGLTSGSYTVYVRDAGGCIAATNVDVTGGPPFDIDLGIDTTIIFGDSIMLEALVNGGIDSLSYFWQGSYDGTIDCESCPVVTVKPEYEIDYTLLVIDANGCEAEDRVRVSVRKIKVVEVPTGFTPNGDNRNDLLVVHGRPGTFINSFQVFDRWGEVVYEDAEYLVNETTRGWDGLVRDQPINGGVFVWQVEVLYEDGSTELLTGQTTLIR